MIQQLWPAAFVSGQFSAKKNPRKREGGERINDEHSLEARCVLLYSMSFSTQGVGGSITEIRHMYIPSPRACFDKLNDRATDATG